MDERRKAIFVGFHDLDFRHHLCETGRTVGAGTAAGLRPRHGRDQGHHRRAPRQPASRLHQRSGQCARYQATSSATANCSTRFSASAARSLSATSRAAGGALYLLYTHDDQRRELIDYPALIPRRSKSACGSAATAISPSRASLHATPKSAAPAFQREWWCALRRLRRTTIRMCFPIRCASIFTASRSASCRSARALTIASAIFSALDHHYRDHAAFGPVSARAHPRPAFQAGLWRRCGRIAPAKPADANSLKIWLS